MNFVKKETKNKWVSIRVTEKDYKQIKEQSKIYGTTTLYIEHLLKNDEINIKTRTNKE